MMFSQQSQLSLKPVAQSLGASCSCMLLLLSTTSLGKTSVVKTLQGILWKWLTWRTSSMDWATAVKPFSSAGSDELFLSIRLLLMAPRKCLQAAIWGHWITSIIESWVRSTMPWTDFQGLYTMHCTLQAALNVSNNLLCDHKQAQTPVQCGTLTSSLSSTAPENVVVWQWHLSLLIHLSSHASPQNSKVLERDIPNPSLQHIEAQN